VLAAASSAAAGDTAQPESTAKYAIEEMVVVGDTQSRTVTLTETVDITPDSAVLLKKAVGANVVSNGPITGMAQYRGMSRFRISSHIDGAMIGPGGPNWMDPPLSYAPAANLEAILVYRGISPVSAGQETIGGVIDATTWRGSFFSDDELHLSGRARAGSQSVNNATLLSGAAVVAKQSQLLKLSAMTEQAGDAEFANGEILPTEYDRQRYDLGYGLRFGDHELRLDYGRNETGNAGTAALPMDIEYIDSDLYRIGYRLDGDAYTLNARLYQSNVDHGMTNYHLRAAAMNPGMYRRNVTDVKNRGFAVKLSVKGWTLGVDGHDELHNSNVSNPNNPMFFVENFNAAERRVLGAFAEHEWQLESGLTLDIGVRYNHVSSDADTVNATPAVMGMAPAVALRDSFNSAERSQNDDNLDWVVRAYVPQGNNLMWYAGVARKSRAPAYQERYLWLPMQATAGLADGRTYTGNIELKSEIAHEIELGFDWWGERGKLAPRVFYRKVDDYIQGTPSINNAAIMFVNMMNMMNGTSNAAPLQFENVDATFYGLDVDWHYRFGERWSMDGVLNLIRGERDDINDDLYRISPANAVLTLNYQRAAWGLSLEGFFYDEQNRVSETNSELQSEGYALFNLKGYWQLTDQLKLGFGIDNLIDSEYEDHLAGVNRVRGNPDIDVGARLPGYGRNFFARVDFSW
jgi:iron complex outermembrane receptor protein